MKKNIIKNLIRILFVFFIILISYMVIVDKKIILDEWMAHFVSSIRCDELDFAMKFITSFGNTATVFILLFVVVWLLIKMVKKRKLAFFFFSGLVVDVFVNQGIKMLIKRERPINSLIEIGGFSFPSGHAMVSMAFYGMLIYIFYKLIDDKRLRNFLIGIFGVLILLIGFSRIYLGVHYFSDVLIGFAISILYLDVFVCFSNRYKLFT